MLAEIRKYELEIMKTVITLLFLTSINQIKAQDYQFIFDSLSYEASNPQNSEPLRSKLYYNVAWYGRQLKKPVNEVIVNANKALVISKRLALDTIIFNSFKLLSIVYYEQNHFDSAFSVANEGIVHFNKVVTPELAFNIAPLYMIAANSLMHLNKQSESLLFHEQARELFIERQDTSGFISVTNSLGLLYTSLELYDEALKHFDFGIKMARVCRPDFVPVFYNSLAITYTKVGDEEKAKKGYFECIRQAKENGNLLALANGYNNLALRVQAETPDSALIYYDKAISIFHKLNQSGNEKRVLLNICELHLDLEHFETARNQLLELATAPRESESQYLLCLARLANADKEYVKSLEFANKALESSGLGEGHEEELYLLIYSLNKTYLGNTGAALDAYERYVDLSQKKIDQGNLISTQKSLVENYIYQKTYSPNDKNDQK